MFGFNVPLPPYPKQRSFIYIDFIYYYFWGKQWVYYVTVSIMLVACVIFWFLVGYILQSQVVNFWTNQTTNERFSTRHQELRRHYKERQKKAKLKIKEQAIQSQEITDQTSQNLEEPLFLSDEEFEGITHRTHIQNCFQMCRSRKVVSQEELFKRAMAMPTLDTISTENTH